MNNNHKSQYQHYLTYFQSWELFKIGLNPYSADMTWQYNKSENKEFISMQPFEDFLLDLEIDENPIIQKDIEYIPCWSSGRLMDLLPDKIVSPKDTFTYFFDLNKADKRYILEYNTDPSNPLSNKALCRFESEHLIDVVWITLKWLIVNDLYSESENVS